MFILKHILYKGFCFQTWPGEVESYTSYTDQLCFLPLTWLLPEFPSFGRRKSLPDGLVAVLLFYPFKSYLAVSYPRSSQTVLFISTAGWKGQEVPVGCLFSIWRDSGYLVFGHPEITARPLSSLKRSVSPPVPCFPWRVSPLQQAHCHQAPKTNSDAFAKRQGIFAKLDHKQEKRKPRNQEASTAKKSMQGSVALPVV